MSAKGKTSAATQQKTSYLDMVVESVQALKDRKGASRAAIARWVQINHKKEGGAAFNAYLRSAIKKGLESGILKEGQSAQRFKIGQLPKAVKPKKKVVSKKKSSSSKKKTAKKTATKKKSSSKKKGSSKKKSGSKKKTNSKKKTGSKKEKGSSKKKSGSKKKTNSKKKT